MLTILRAFNSKHLSTTHHPYYVQSHVYGKEFIFLADGSVTSDWAASASTVARDVFAIGLFSSCYELICAIDMTPLIASVIASVLVAAVVDCAGAGYDCT